MHRNVHPRTGRAFPLVSAGLRAYAVEHAAELDQMVDHSRDFSLTYFGIKTMEKLYLVRIGGVVAETPQFLFMRVAVALHGEKRKENNDANEESEDDENSGPNGQNPRARALARIKETYNLMSQKYFIHASPTLFNAGTPNNYLLSCFLQAVHEDSIDGIYKTLHQSAMISKASGGIGLHVHDIRAAGAAISTSNGTSSGLVPMLRVFNDTARYVDQGGNKRPGAFAVYLEPWHADVVEVLELRKNHGKEEMRARDLFYGLWVPDLFMRRVRANGQWSLFSPDEAPGLADVCGDEFVRLYESYEASGLAVKSMPAQKLWALILEAQTETGLPYMLYKDACNEKSNQKNLGTIKSSNLCTEIVEYSSRDETAVCNLASIALPSFVYADGEKKIDLFDRAKDRNTGSARVASRRFDFTKLHAVTKTVVRNLDRIIDIGKYPVASAKTSNFRHRPVAVGVQGLADTFLQLRIPFDSPQARTLNIQIFETIYHAAVEASVELARTHGPYSTFSGSPASHGLLQFDLWHHAPLPFFRDWHQLKRSVQKYGLRNSLLVAPMPTASTSQILGFNECFEPFTSNLYTRRVLSGEFQVVNKYLVQDLMDLNMWNSAVKNHILKANGLVQTLPGFPDHLKQLYKTVWEISQRTIIDMAADRAKFIDQLQSMNIHLQNPTFAKLTSCHFYAWEKGLKTGMYYLRTQAASRAIQFTVDNDIVEPVEPKELIRPTYVEAKSFDDDSESESKPSDSDGSDTPDFVPSKKRRFSDSYDIYDTTPVACDIKDPGNCESCSG